MASFSTITDIDLEKQVAALSKELAALKRTVSRQTSAFNDDGRSAAWDYYADLAERVGHRLPSFGRPARAIEHSARDHPATAAAVGLAVLGLIALLFSRR